MKWIPFTRTSHAGFFVMPKCHSITTARVTDHDPPRVVFIRAVLLVINIIFYEKNNFVRSRC
jgi:hypothetical protein